MLCARASERSSAGPVSGTRAAEVAVRDPAGGVRHGLDGPGEATREDHGEGDGHPAGHDRRDREHERDALVEHGAGVVRRVARRHHERGERVRPNPQDTEGDDREGDCGHGEQRHEDPGADRVHFHPGVSDRVTAPAAR